MPVIGAVINHEPNVNHEPVNAQLEFDLDRLYDCYNEGEIVFFNNGRLAYDGDDFTLIEPERWLAPEHSLGASKSLELHFTRVEVEEEPMSITLYDKDEFSLIYNETLLPEAGDILEIETREDAIAFTLAFHHSTAMLDVTFDLVDPKNPENRSTMNYGLNCP